MEVGKYIEKMQKSVAVVILNWNGKDLLERFLPSVIESTYSNLEIYVADNASTDNSVDFIRKFFPNVKIISLDKNYGYAMGYNIALSQISSDYYVLLNSDVEVKRDWIEPVIYSMEKDSMIAAAQPKIKSQISKDKFEYAGAAGGFLDLYCYPFCRGRIFDVVEDDFDQYNKDIEVFWASGAALFVKAKVWHQLGGLDADFFAHMEEIDFCWRIKNSGNKVVAVMSSEVYHVGAATLSETSPFKTYLNFRNNLIMMQKNLPAGQREFKIFLRFFLDFIAWMKYLLSGKFNYSKAISKAHFYFLKNWKLNSRKYDGTAKPYLKHVGIYKKSIVFDFFIKRKKSFSDLKF